ncbi:unnamed protein product [Urochloa decumbens]|uniref:F-box domain-containing protein n=1 Tax=Urochloa decumbens TaxID=240449 RepID=A0ABC8XU94_9POAL
MAIGRELTDDLIAQVLRRLPPRSLATSRGVCRAWRELVDARQLLRVDLLPRSVGGIFMNYLALNSPEFFSRPTMGPSISGDLEFIPGFSMVVDHCNGLLLIAGTSRGHDYVCNPATRGWAWLPPRPTLHMGEEFDQIKCLVYDPNVSPHYKVFLVPSLADDQPMSMLDPEMMQSEWPPSPFALQVFSSITECWEERSFVLEGGRLEERSFLSKGGRRVRAITDMKAYIGEKRSTCSAKMVLISISDAKYRLIPTPSDVELGHHDGCLSLGRSEKGVYCAFEHDCHGLRIFLLNESCGQAGWELKHLVDLTSFARKFHARGDSSQQHKGPWILQDINYYKYPYDNDNPKELVEDNFEWNSDDDNILNTDDMVEGHFQGYTGLLGFHPHKEIVFLNVSLRRAVAYHWNISKFQDLGNIFPKEYLEVAGHCAQIDTSFTYTPCWMDDFPESKLEAPIEN